MPRRTLSIAALAAVTILSGLPTAPATAAEIQPTLAQKLETAAPDELLNVYVLLEAQLDGASTLAEVQTMNRRERRAHVISRLEAIAAEAQAPLLAQLEALRPSGAVGEITSLWIANLLIAELNPATIQSLAGDSAVQSLALVRPYAPGEATDDLPPTSIPPAVPAGAPEPNIDLIEAPDVWAKGYMGQGMVVANIDTGTDETHPDLANHIWENIDEVINGLDDDNNGFVDDVIGWDFESNDNDPTPGSGHGTSTAGIVVGDGTNGRQTGVAPMGNIMILKACGESIAMQAVQYAIDNGADAITSSCSYKFPFEPEYATWREISENTMLAGVPHANSIGNQGQQTGTYPIPYNISAPAITPPSWLHPEQTIIGGLGALVATGGVNVNLSQYGPSGKGPSAWEDIQINYPGQNPIPPEYWDYPWANGTMQGLLKPEIVMPTNVWSTSIGGGYTVFGGTSAATPHSGGSLALLLSAAPNATPEQISEALQTHVMDLGPPGKDNEYGSGLAQLLSAAGSLVPNVTPVLYPYGQAIDPGGTLFFEIELINNTQSPLQVVGRLDFHFNGHTRTMAGPGTLNIPVGGKFTKSWHTKTPPAISDLLMDVELVVEDTSGGVIATTDVQAYIR